MFTQFDPEEQHTGTKEGMHSSHCEVQGKNREVTLTGIISDE